MSLRSVVGGFLSCVSCEKSRLLGESCRRTWVFRMYLLHAVSRAAVVFLVFLLQAHAPGATVGGSFEFDLSGSELTHEFSFSTGGAAVARPTVSGLLKAVVSWDDETLKPEAFYLESDGFISVESHSLDLTATLTPDDSPTVSIYLRNYFSGLGITIRKMTADGKIAKETGLIDPAHFSFRLDVGEVNSTVEADGWSESAVYSYFDNPESLSISVTPRIRIERTGSNYVSDSYRVFLNLELYRQNVEVSDELNTTGTETIRCVIETDASYVRKTKFGEWAEVGAGNFFPALEPGRKTSNGISIELAYALNLRLSRRAHRYPIRWLPVEGGMQLYVVSGILNQSIAIEMTPSMSEPDWAPIPSEWLMHGAQSLLEGSHDAIFVNVPDSERTVFLRIRVPADALSR